MRRPLFPAAALAALALGLAPAAANAQEDPLGADEPRNRLPGRSDPGPDPSPPEAEALTPGLGSDLLEEPPQLEGPEDRGLDLPPANEPLEPLGETTPPLGDPTPPAGDPVPGDADPAPPGEPGPPPVSDLAPAVEPDRPGAGLRPEGGRIPQGPTGP